MMTNRRILLVFVLILAVTLVAGCGSTPTPTPTPEPPTATPEPTPAQSSAPQATAEPSRMDLAMQNVQRLEGETLATVNGEEITWDEYEPALRQALLLLSQQYEINWADPAMKQRLAQVQNDVLRQVVDRSLLRKMAGEQGITVDDETLNAQIEHEKSSILNGGQYADWETFLQKNGLTEKSFVQVIYDTLLYNAFLQAQDVDTEGDQAHIAHIIVSDPETADEVVAKLQAGEDFADLAAQYSIDDQTKDNGGDLGWFTQEMMAPELGQTAFSLEPGQWDGPISTQYGYAVIKVLERAVRPLEPRALRQRQQDAIMVQLEAERTKAVIVYLVDFTANQ